ncbi:MAG: hypothetical protein ACOH2M_24265 [Cypionkella sp.]
MTPATLNFDIQRNSPFLESIRFRGLDFTAGTFAMQFRAYRGATGAALIDLENATAGTEGLSVVVTTEGGIPVSEVFFQIDKTTVQATLPWPANGQKAGTDVPIEYDLKVTGGGVDDQPMVAGTATIRERVTP